MRDRSLGNSAIVIKKTGSRMRHSWGEIMLTSCVPQGK